VDNFKLLTPPEQLAAHLLEQILRGVWRGEMPGAPAVATDLEVDHRVVIAAFCLLENEGLLEAQGAGRRRRILLPENYSPAVLRLQILSYEDNDRQQFYLIDLLHQLIKEGHTAGFAPKTLHQLGMDAPRDVSLVCLDPDPAFAWCQPSVAHIHWEPLTLVRRIVRWADNVARGKDDRRQSFTKAEFVEGGTIGPAPKC
jgi:hypothetical protein